MLVYGDRARTLSPRGMLRDLTTGLREAEAAPAGPGRHDLLTKAFLTASGLAQGLADAEFEVRGEDAPSPLQDAAMALLIALARKLAASAWSGFANAGPPVSAELMALALRPAPDRIRVKTPEGYAFYAVYPEAVLKAAAGRRWNGRPLVIGLRSIGTGLAALAAAVTGAEAAVTLRPCGHPFRRSVRVSGALRSRLAAHAGPFAIIDEGPGLSGSSFGAAADLLETLGVAPERIVFMPSHAGDLGPEASEKHRVRWAQALRAPATFEDLAAEDPPGAWFTDLTGSVATAEDLAGGRWRGGAADAPPADPGRERLKFRLATATGAWLAKFAGLGGIGEAKFIRAKALHAAGFTPEPLALRRGFLLERWAAGEPGARVARPRLVAHLGRYLGFRAGAFPADAEDGASLDELQEMVRVNAGELLGAEAGRRLAAEVAAVRAEAGPAQPVFMDGRLHAWEWRVTPDGALLKTDALDHAQAHDLVGCQDIAWDVAGARAEFDLTDAEVAAVCAGVAAASGRRPDPALVRLFDIAYPAFQAGCWSLAEAPAQTARYRGRLARAASLSAAAW